MLEDQIEASADHWAESKGMLVRKLQYPGRRGAPDKMYIWNGRVVFVEWKKPGGTVKGLQLREQRWYRQAGAEYYILDNVAEFKEIMLNGA